ncbi:phosphoserine phosphatase SerB [Neisseria sp. Ec49-e6-T10]|uniref:phosphoserine phosphatase SerB n=1 Tax=Neisseria sp. Ec49-e6-T10 TaxID=3140744 RepID=UPI003EBF024E
MSKQRRILVIQGETLSQFSVNELFEKIGVPLNSTFTLGNVQRISVPDEFLISPELQIWFDEHKIDANLLEDQAFSQIKLIVSDMDSTLITIECIDEIAHEVGLKEQVAKITDAAMQGKIDFNESLIQRVALLEGVTVEQLERVYQQRVKLTEGAEQFIQMAKQAGIYFVLVSGGFTFFTEKLKQSLHLDDAIANELEIYNGVLTGKVVGQIINAQSKAQILQQKKQNLGLAVGQVLAVGDGANDLLMLQAADYGVAFHAKPKVKQFSSLKIDFNGLDAIRYFFR